MTGKDRPTITIQRIGLATARAAIHGDLATGRATKGISLFHAAMAARTVQARWMKVATQPGFAFSRIQERD